jgi:trimeric autotransporter adhesin
MGRIGDRSAWAALALVAAVSGPAGAQTAVSGPITFGTGLSVSNTGGVSIAASQSGLTCSGCTLSGGTTLSGATTLPNGTITSGGLVGIGVTAIGGSGGPTAPLTIDSALVSGGTGSPSIVVQGTLNKERVEVDSAGAVPRPTFQGKGFGGTIASPTATQAGMELFGLGGGGFNGSAFSASLSAYMQVYAADNWTTSDLAAYLTFGTTPSGGTASIERMRITAAGLMGIGTTTPGYLLDVEGGQVNASGGFVAGGTVGVTCSGTPTAAFAATAGIVTHC